MSKKRILGTGLFRVGILAAQIALVAGLSSAALPQESGKNAEAKSIPQLPAQIELLETKYRFETNGDSRKEVYARVRINNELGVQQFARLKFNYNCSFQSVEIPLLRITHPSGGTAEILPGAIVDNPDPAVVNFPAYHDVRVKSVRILGLGPGDLLEYRVITKTIHPPLAPDFWLEHSFDHTGLVLAEDFVLDVPASAAILIDQDTPAASLERSGQGRDARIVYHWRREQKDRPSSTTQASSQKPDIALSTTKDWGKLSARLADLLYPASPPSPEIKAKATKLTACTKNDEERLRAIYDFVAEKIITVDLPLGATGYRTRKPEDILSSGYGIPEDKAALFTALAQSAHFEPHVYLTFSGKDKSAVSLPARFEHLLLGVPVGDSHIWLDPALEVAPFGMVFSRFRSKPVFFVSAKSPPALVRAGYFPDVPDELPFHALQRVEVHAELSTNGTLEARVRYTQRGDNELLLRVAFHRNPKDKWKDLAQLLALSDGFRGHVTSVEASDPYATTEPFRVEYEVTQPKFVNWAKEPVRIPAILPLVGLPEPPPPTSTAPVELGTPLDVDLRVTLKLPPGTSVRVPTGTSVARDYAEFSSNYSSKEETLNASRHLRFLLRVVTAGRAADYNAFVHAVENDEAQDFTLERPAAPPPNTHPPSATPKLQSALACALFMLWTTPGKPCQSAFGSGSVSEFPTIRPQRNPMRHGRSKYTLSPVNSQMTRMTRPIRLE